MANILYDVTACIVCFMLPYELIQLTICDKILYVTLLFYFILLESYTMV